MSAWVVPPPGADAAAVRLFCFAHAGGGGTFFRPWRDGLGPGVEPWPVTLPGRESRIRDRPLRDLDELLDLLHTAIRPHLGRPFALFGHSMGTLVAYELARRLGPEADALLGLVVSGRRAPHLAARRPPLHPLPDSVFIDQVSAMNGTPSRVLREPELLRMFMPALRADFEINETYVPRPGAGLSCPVLAMVGDADPEADLDEMAAWRSTTTGPFTLRVFRGDHFYLKGTPEPVLRALRTELLQLRTVAGGAAQS